MKALTRAHIAAERELRELLVGMTTRTWKGLGSYDRADVAPWLAQVLPVVEAAQRRSVALTEAYIARSLDRPVRGLPVEELLGASVRAGAPPAEVYARPFVTVWTALGNGSPYEQAVASGLARANEAARADVQLSARATFAAAQQTEGFYGYQRVADGNACEFCSLVDGAYVKFADAMALHPGCGCSLEALTEPHPRAAKLPSGVAVHEHGELGPVLGSPDHDFTSQADL